MKKFTTFLIILKYFVTDEDLNNLMQRYEYSDTTRKFTVSELVSFFTTAAINEWTNSRHRIVEFTDYEGKLIRVVTNLRNVSAETIAAIYKACWGVEVFFHWIKQHLNVPRLFGTTKDAVYNQLYAALLSYVILRFIHLSISKTIRERKLSFLGFTRRLTPKDLSLEWRANLNHFLRKIAFL